MVLEVSQEKSSDAVVTEKALSETKSEAMVSEKAESDKKVEGVVTIYHRRRGYGFIKTKESVGDVFVHWEDIITDDPCPLMKKGLEVEFELETIDGKHMARKLKMKGGAKIPMYTLEHLKGKINEEDIFTGSIKSYTGGKGFGFIKPDQEITWKGKTCGKDDMLFFYRAAIVTKREKGLRPKLDKGLRVSFKVMFDGGKNLGAWEIQNEDGTPIKSVTRKELMTDKKVKRKRDPEKVVKKVKKKGSKVISPEELKKMEEEEEKRKKERIIIDDGRTYTGVLYNHSPFWKWSTGTIQLNQRIWHEEQTLNEFIHFDKRDCILASPEIIPQRGREVMFQVYLSPTGLRACEVKLIDGSPLGSEPGSNKSEGQETKKREREEGESQRATKKMKREVVNDGKTYIGTVKKFNFKKKHWEIVLKDEQVTYKKFHAWKIKAYKWDVERASAKDKLKPKMEVMFKVYNTPKGFAAFEVKNTDGTPIGYRKENKDELVKEKISSDQQGETHQSTDMQVNEESSPK